MNRRLFLSACGATLLAGCGFRLRRLDGIPFASLYVDAPAGSLVGPRVVALLKSVGSVKLVSNPAEAEAIVKLHTETRKKTILSLSGAGRVTEYRLTLELSYEVVDREGRVLAAPETIELVRDMTYDDSALLAKSSEEGLLYRDMDDDAARRIGRRLQAVKPGAAR